MPRKGWPLAPAFGGCGLDGAWRSAEVCHQEIDGEVWPRCNFKPLVFSQFRTAVDNRLRRAALHDWHAAVMSEIARLSGKSWTPDTEGRHELSQPPFSAARRR